MRKTVTMFAISGLLVSLVLYFIDCIINGESALRNEFPSTVRLVYNGENNFSQPLCTGVILKEILILTAGHCLKDIHLSNIVVVAGDYHRIAIEDTEQRRQVVGNFSHPLMDYEHAMRYDLTILQLDTPLIFGESVLPTTLPEKDFDAKDRDVALTFSGWGIDTKPDDEQFKFPDILQKLILQVIDTKSCEQMYRFHADGNEDFSGVLCGFNVLDNATPCAADSGGGAFYVNGTEKVLAGILSYTLDCNRTAPAVFTRINEKVVAWIEEIINNNTLNNIQRHKTENKNYEINKARSNSTILVILISVILIACFMWKRFCPQQGYQILSSEFKYPDQQKPTKTNNNNKYQAN